MLPQKGCQLGCLVDCTLRPAVLKKAELPDWAGGLEAAPGWKERGTPLCAGEEGPHARSSRWGSHRVCLVCRAARNQQWFWGLLGELESLGCLLSACPSSTLRELGQEWARGGQEGAVWVLKAPSQGGCRGGENPAGSHEPGWICPQPWFQTPSLVLKAPGLASPLTDPSHSVQPQRGALCHGPRCLPPE